MTWIQTVPIEQADETLRRCYEAVYHLFPPEYRQEVAALRRADGESDSITAAHSLIPEAMRHAMSAFGVLLNPELPLSRRQHEMIATVVSRKIAASTERRAIASSCVTSVSTTNSPPRCGGTIAKRPTSPSKTALSSISPFSSRSIHRRRRPTAWRSSPRRLRRSRHLADHAHRRLVQLHQSRRRRPGRGARLNNRARRSTPAISSRLRHARR